MVIFCAVILFLPFSLPRCLTATIKNHINPYPVDNHHEDVHTGIRMFEPLFFKDSIPFAANLFRGASHRTFLPAFLFDKDSPPF